MMNESLLTADQAQSLNLGLTFTVAEPPAALILLSFGLSLNVQPPAA
jgi:hypothetical protein